MPVLKLPGEKLERGDLRLLVLDALKTPMHGYQIICTLKEQSCGDYKPSTGALYPQLESLEKEGLIKIGEGGGKKVYSLTGKGIMYMQQNKKLLEDTKRRFEEFWKDTNYGELVGVVESLFNLWERALGDALRRNDPKDVERIDRSKKLLLKLEKELKQVWQ